jgi:pyruvate,water dikinase
MAAQRMDEFQTALTDLIAQFGHLSDNGNDFSAVPWRESRDMILNLVADYQMRKEPTAAKKVQIQSIRTSFARRQIIERVYRYVRKLMLHRERISYLYTFGYGLFRVYFLALGSRFVKQGWTAQDEDIFYLDYETVCQLVEKGEPPTDLSQVVTKHKQAMDEAQNITMPPIIYGDQPPPVETSNVRKLSGTPTSSGYCTGRLKIVKGLQDFGKVCSGDVLVIPFSDVGWTPLFTRSVGVIAESGGILSHSSIIAREFGIPAVVSVLGSMQLQDGTLVTIDGFKGEVIIHEEEVSDCT